MKDIAEKQYKLAEKRRTQRKKRSNDEKTPQPRRNGEKRNQNKLVRPDREEQGKR